MLKIWYYLHLLEGLQTSLVDHTKSPPFQSSKCHPPMINNYFVSHDSDIDI
jgi:hypothetical protein